MLQLKKEYQHAFGDLSKLIIKLVQELPVQGTDPSDKNLLKHIQVYTQFNHKLFAKRATNYMERKAVFKHHVHNLQKAGILRFHFGDAVFLIQESNLLEEEPNK